MKLSYLLTILTAALIVLFYLGLPPLRSVPLTEDAGRGRATRREGLAVGLLTLLYAVLAFWGLGDRQAPQSLRSFDGDSAVLTLEEPCHISRVLLYTGAIPGSYSFEVSRDGDTWLALAEYDQNYASLLKWQELDLSGAPEGEVLALRVTGHGGAELGEIALFDGDGSLRRVRTEATELSDEQALVPPEPSYLNSSYFDEIYHARTAWEHLRGIKPYEISHPPLGKLLIGLGIRLFGMTPFGWRFMGTLFGVLMLPAMWWFARRLFGGRTVPLCCTLLLAADFMHFTQTRIATIDSFSVLFILLMYGFMWCYFSTDKWRYLALSGLFFGLGAATKWICLYAGFGLGLLWLGYWLACLLDCPGEERGELGRRFVKNVGFCLIFFVALPALIYALSYWPYAAPSGVRPLSGDYFRLVWDNQKYMFHYHAGVNATHPYSSRWYQWMLDIRPILYYMRHFADGSRSSFGAWLNPVLCWAGLLAVFVLVYMTLARGDRKAAFLLLAYLAQLLPWVFISRITFEYHYFACSIFLVLALGYVMSLMRTAGGRWCWRALGLCALAAAVFVLFYPALSGLRVDNALATRLLKWLPTWPFLGLPA